MLLHWKFCKTFLNIEIPMKFSITQKFRQKFLLQRNVEIDIFYSTLNWILHIIKISTKFSITLKFLLNFYNIEILITFTTTSKFPHFYNMFHNIEIFRYDNENCYNIEEEKIWQIFYKTEISKNRQNFL